MSKHTPGPWYAFTVGSASTNPNGAYLLSGPKTVLMDRTVGFTKADAELLAAAPYLLEALEGLLSSYESVMHSEFDYPGDEWSAEGRDDEDALKAIAAIARAKGEQP